MQQAVHHKSDPHNHLHTIFLDIGGCVWQHNTEQNMFCFIELILKDRRLKLSINQTINENIPFCTEIVYSFLRVAAVRTIQSVFSLYCFIYFGWNTHSLWSWSISTDDYTQRHTKVYSFSDLTHTIFLQDESYVITVCLSIIEPDDFIALYTDNYHA